MAPTKTGDIIVVYPGDKNPELLCNHNGTNKIPAVVTQTFDTYQNGECNCRAFTDGPGDSAPLWYTSIPHKSAVGEDKPYPEGTTCWDWN